MIEMHIKFRHTSYLHIVCTWLRTWLISYLSSIKFIEYKHTNILLRDIGMGEPILRPMDYTIKYGIHLHLIGKRMKKKMLSHQRLCVFYVFLIVWVYQIKIYSCMPELINLTHRIWQIWPMCPRSNWNMGEILAFLA